jgi:hypothetical protein
MERPKEDLGPAVSVGQVRRRLRLRLASIMVADVAITTVVVVVLHALGLC